MGAALPLSVLFGLSMDYRVFLLSRIREKYVELGENRRAVEFGIVSTGRLITGGAHHRRRLLGLRDGDLIMFQQMGFGVAVALLLDATIVRSVLVPATMTLLGGWNWYSPRGSPGSRTSTSTAGRRRGARRLRAGAERLSARGRPARRGRETLARARAR